VIINLKFLLIFFSLNDFEESLWQGDEVSGL
jgi:hypothetical protein